MVRRIRSISLWLVAVSLALATESAFAQGTERYLPSGSQIVVQVDAHQKTKAAYDRTALGQMMQGDTGKFLREFWRWALDAGEKAGDHFDVLSKDDATLIRESLAILDRLGEEGLALGIEVKQVWPPDARLVVVLPKLATGTPNLPKLLAGLRAKSPRPDEIKEEKVEGRNVTHMSMPFVNLDWWAQGDDMLLTIGTGTAAEYLKALDTGKTGLADNLAYKKLLELGAFPTRSRAYLDVPNLVKLADINAEASRTVDELGLRGLGPVLSIAGYDGAAQRSITEVETIGARKGFVAMMSEKKITLDSLPPMPSDLTSFSAGNTGAGQAYAIFLDMAEKVGGIYFPDQVGDIKNGIKGFEDLIGVDLRKDLFGSFDNGYVQYSSPSEGILNMGSTALFKVKDEARLKKALSNLIAAVPQLPGVEMGFKKRNYRGAEIVEFTIQSPGSNMMICFCVYKGHFGYASTPQPLQGYILRADGVLPTWKAEGKFAKALEAIPKEFTSISISDPQPMVEGALAAAPGLISIANGFVSFLPDVAPFDVSIIPHAQLATRHLFPSVSYSIDDGRRIRSDSRSSLGW
jgi:hypothetical protein